MAARVVVLCLMMAVACAAPVRADPGQDATLFQILQRYQLGYTTRGEAISAAGSTCAALDRGASYGQLQTAMFNASGQAGPGSWTLRDVDQFMFAATSAYCPRYMGLVPQSSLVPR